MSKNQFKEWLISIGHLFSKPRSRITVKKILVFLFGLTFIIITYVLSFPYFGGGYENLKEGSIAPEEIRVYQDVRYLDEELTAKYRKDAYLKRRYVFDRDYAIFNENVENFTDEFTGQEKQSADYSRAQALEAMPFLRGQPAQVVDSLLKAADRKRVVRWGARYATEVFDRFGILKEKLPKLEKFYSVGADIRTINSPSEHEKMIFASDQVVYHENVFTRAYQRLSSLGDESFRNQLEPGLRRLVIRRVLRQFQKNPYLSYNAAETKKAKLAARNDPANNRYQTIPQGTVIARASTVIDKDTFKKIKIIEEYQKTVSFRYFAGMFLVQLMLALAVAVFLFRYADFRLADLSSHIIMHSLILITVFYAFILSRFSALQTSDHYFALWIPIGFTSTLMGILFGARVTLAVGFYLSIFLFMIAGNETPTLVLSMVCVVAGIYASERMQKRTQFLQGAGILVLCMFVVVIGMDLMLNNWGARTLYRLLIALANGFLGMVLAVGVLPIYEMIFNLPTKFRLMELADSDNALLRKVANEAPSTYTHTLTVSSLSERAVRAIGGDTLLTRVGCLYHDIGKTINPSFYAENKHLFPTSEKFKKLGPLKSAQIILAHVIDGVRMGREARLPEKVISFIPEHHGTTTMQFFYHKALEDARKKKSKRKLPKELFQYPGPRPQTRETGIVMIADSVEAAARSLKEPTEENLSELIDRIIENKMAEDQFDECPLTLGDLKKTKAAFLEVLISSFHLRPAYPSMKKTQDLEKKEQSTQSKAKTKSKTATKKKTTTTRKQRKR